MEALALNADRTMSSLEIAELTGKRHDNVMVDIVCEHNKISTAALPQYTEKVRTVCSATHLLKLNNCQLTTRAFNVALISAGYLEQKERLASKGKIKKYNSLTEKGLKFGQNDAFKGRSTETQAHYFEDSFMELYGLVC